MADSDEVKTTQSWATAAAVISAITLAIILFGGLMYVGITKGWFDFSKWSWPKIGEWGIFSKLSAGGVSLGTIMAAVVLFIPDTAVLGGFIADAVNARFRYSIPSIAGLFAGILNWASTFLTGGDATVTQYSLGNPRGDTPAKAAAAAAPAAAGVVTQAANAVTNVAAGAAGAAQQVASVIGFGGQAAAAPPLSADRIVGAAPPAPPSVVPRRPAAFAGAPGNSVIMTEFTDLPGPRGGKKQKGGARFDGNPSAILGIPLGSKAQPAGLAVLITILMIYTMDAIYDKRHGTALWVQISIAIATVGAYIFAYYKTEVFGKIVEPSLDLTGWWRMSIPIIVGLVGGGIAFTVMKTNYPGYLPLDPDTSSPVTLTGEYSKCAAGTGGVGPNGGDLVCDAYLNGERIGTVPP